MPERLIVAYLLIALMVVAALIWLGSVLRYSRTYARLLRWWRHHRAK